MSIFGISPLGTGLGPFGGPGLITVLGVLRVSNNEVVVVFDREPATLDPQAYDSGTNPDNYAIAAVDPTIALGTGGSHVPLGEVVPQRFPSIGVATQDADDATQVALSTDAAMEPGVRYDVTISSVIVGAGGETMAGTLTWQIQAPKISKQPRQAEISVERYRDFDWIINPGPGEVGRTFRHESSGDIGLQDATTSLRKRIYRRVFTPPGGFAYLPNYGVGLRLKALAKAGQVQELSNLIAEQIKREPDVLNVGVEVYVETTAQGAFVNVDAFVQQQDAVTRKLSFREVLQ